MCPMPLAVKKLAMSEQVWKDITERICQGLQELEAVSPPNVNQLKDKKVTQADIEADLKKKDPVLPEH